MRNKVQVSKGWLHFIYSCIYVTSLRWVINIHRTIFISLSIDFVSWKLSFIRKLKKRNVGQIIYPVCRLYGIESRYSWFMSQKWEKIKSKLRYVESSFGQKVWSTFPIAQCRVASPLKWRQSCLLLNEIKNNIYKLVMDYFT